MTRQTLNPPRFKNNAFIVAFPTASQWFPAFLRLAAIMDRGGYWDNNAYTQYHFQNYNNGEYVAKSTSVLIASNAMNIVTLFQSGMPYNNPNFAALRVGKPGVAGLTEEEFLGIRADIELVLNPTIGLDEFAAQKGWIPCEGEEWLPAHARVNP